MEDRAGPMTLIGELAVHFVLHVPVLHGVGAEVSLRREKHGVHQGGHRGVDRSQKGLSIRVRAIPVEVL